MWTLILILFMFGAFQLKAFGPYEEMQPASSASSLAFRSQQRGIGLLHRCGFHVLELVLCVTGRHREAPTGHSRATPATSNRVAQRREAVCLCFRTSPLWNIGKVKLNPSCSFALFSLHLVSWYLSPCLSSGSGPLWYYTAFNIAVFSLP